MPAGLHQIPRRAALQSPAQEQAADAARRRGRARPTASGAAHPRRWVAARTWTSPASAAPGPPQAAGSSSRAPLRWTPSTSARTKSDRRHHHGPPERSKAASHLTLRGSLELVRLLLLWQLPRQIRAQVKQELAANPPPRDPAATPRDFFDRTGPNRGKKKQSFLGGKLFLVSAWTSSSKKGWNLSITHTEMGEQNN